MDPKTLRYSPTHEWVHLDGDVATIGISRFAVDQLTDLITIDLPKVGTKLSRGKSFGEVESVKAVSDLYAPISGKVAEINEALVQKPEVINTDPYGQAWMIVVEPTDLGELGQLLDASAYAVLVGERGT